MLPRLMDDVADLRLEVTRHPVFYRAWSEASLRIFMEHHVLAVWDFMSLLKVLQRSLVSSETPWLPPSDPVVARAINSLVLGEESDHLPDIHFTGSHFELYLNAMDEVGASTDGIEKLLGKLAMGYPFAHSLETSSIPAAAQRFTRNTHLLCQKAPHEVAAAFFFGREDIVPDMFTNVLGIIGGKSYPFLSAYLKRHIEVDSGEHRDHANVILSYLCGSSQKLWSEASDAATASLAARRRLWDDVLEAMERQQPTDTEQGDLQLTPESLRSMENV